MQRSGEDLGAVGVEERWDTNGVGSTHIPSRPGRRANQKRKNEIDFINWLDRKRKAISEGQY